MRQSIKNTQNSGRIQSTSGKNSNPLRVTSQNTIS